MENQNSLQLPWKKLLRWLVILVLVFAAYKLIRLYFFMAPIEITTNKPAVIRLYEIPENGADKLVKEVSNGQELKLRASKGRYEARAITADQTALAALHVTDTSPVKRNLELTTGVELLQFTDRSFTATQNRFVGNDGVVYFLDNQDDELYRYHPFTEKLDRLPGSDYPIAAVSWQDGNDYSFITAPNVETPSEYNPIVGVVINGRLRFRQETERAKLDSTVHVARSGNTTVYTIDNRIYRILPNGQHLSVYEHNRDIEQLSFGGDTVAFSDGYSLHDESGDEEFEDVDAEPPKTMVINLETNDHYELPEGASHPLVSPDGRLVAYTTPYNGAVVEAASKKLLGLFSRGNLIAWQDDTIIYLDGTTVYKFNPEQNTSNSLVSDERLSAAADTAWQKGGPAFITAGFVYVLGAPEQAELAGKLLAATPHNSRNYQIHTLFDISRRPTVVITTHAVLLRDSQVAQYNRDTARYRQQALNYLEGQNIPINDVRVIYR